MVGRSLLPLVLLMSCAHVEGERGGPGSDRAAAQRIYTVSEERYAAGDYDEAVELMRHALLQLPPEAEHDRLRHQLVLRIAHTQLRAHAAGGRAAPLHDAQQMLERYLVRHEALLGDDEEARAERGEVYELLFLVERRLEPTAEPEAATDAADATNGAGATTGSTSFATLAGAVWDVLAGAGDPSVESTPAHGAIAASEPAPPAAATTSAAPARLPVSEPPSPERRSAGRSIDADGNQTREVVVPRKRRLASLDDPRVMERLRSDFSSAEKGLVLTRPGVALLHGPRPLVRGTSRLAGRGDHRRQQLARRAGRSLLRDAREPLRGCYAAAYTREPLGVLDSKVEASIHPDGSISHVRIVDGGLVDGYGDACVIEALQAASAEPLAEADEPVRVQVALTFFYQPAVYIVEGTGEQLPAGGVMLRPNPKREEGLPPIDEFAK